MNKRSLWEVVSLSTLMLSLALPVMAASHLPKTSPLATPKKAFDSACMQRAVENRDNGIINVWSTYFTARKTALETRRDALKAAWGLTDELKRKEAVKKAWETFRANAQRAEKDFQTLRSKVWQTFNTERKACGQAPVTEEPSSSSAEDVKI